MVLPISWGGVMHYTAELANALSEQAEVVVLKPRDGNDALFRPGVELRDVFKPIDYSRKDAWKAFEGSNIGSFLSFRRMDLVHEIKPDVVHFPELYPQSAFFSLLSRIDREYPTVVTLHAVYPSLTFQFSSGDPVYSMLAAATEMCKRLVRPRKFVVHNQGDREALLSRGVRSDKVEVIPHGYFQMFKGNGNGSEAQGDNILYFGYIIDDKGLDVLMRAMPAIVRERPGAKAIIAGEGDLRKYQRLMGDGSNFEVFNEYVSNDKVVELFSRSKLVVLPYRRHRGQSGVLTIAFSLGKPVVVTDVGDFPNQVTDGEEGLMVPSGDPDALAGAVVRLLRDDDLRTALGKRAAARAAELSWDNIARRYMEVYRQAREEEP